MSSTVRFKSKKELANEYEMDYRTFLSMLDRNNIDLPKGYLSVNEVYSLYLTFGFPSGQHRIEWEAACKGLSHVD